MKKSLLSLIAASALFTSTANAEFLGVEVGAGSWMPDMTGSFKSGGTVDLENDLGFGDKETTSYFYAQFEHPVPVIPNVKIMQTNLEFDASTTKSVTVLNHVYTGTTNSVMTLNQTDLILYYELSEGILIPFVHLDVGIGIKNLKGKLALTGLVNDSKSFDAPVPMVYGKVKLSTSAIPFIPVDVEYETMQLSVGDNSITDTKMGLVYDVELFAGFNVGAVAGIRKENLTVDTSGVDANIDIEGYYFGAYFNW